MTQRARHGRPAPYGRRTAVLAGALGLLVLLPTDVLATVSIGSPGDDVTFGPDRDNASNTFIQPPGVSARQHLDNTDVVFGRGGDDLVGGRTGSDVLVGGPGHDVLVGGPDVPGRPASDVALGDTGNDVNLWGTGDASETFVGDDGQDTQIVGRLLRNGDELRLRTYQGRKLPRVSLSTEGQSCALQVVPPAQRTGEQYLLRISARGQLSATIRLKDVEQVVCTSPRAGHARVADLTVPSPSFRDVPLGSLRGVVGAIVDEY
ncbi:MAG TPA: hypothetical protein VFR07_09110 [Mycobacteriales bacterium]|jgi:hypothetical protein|nr:hypothetical protein [Mycobacteriales bacterium]